MLPHDQRNFIHKSRFTRGITGAVRGFVTGGVQGALTGGVTGLVGGGQPQPRMALNRPSTRTGGAPVARHRPSDRPGFRAGGNIRRAAAARRRTARTLVSTAQPAGPSKQGRCPSGTKRVRGLCVDIAAALPGGDPLVTRALPAGARGPYGPIIDVREVRICLPGDVLGRDGNCYNRKDISNKNREWPRGRRPLGTPGELAALAKAASFGRRMETTVKRMQKIGVLKKPARRSLPRPRARPNIQGGTLTVIDTE